MRCDVDPDFEVVGVGVAAKDAVFLDFGVALKCVRGRAREAERERACWMVGEVLRRAAEIGRPRTRLNRRPRPSHRSSVAHPPVQSDSMCSASSPRSSPPTSPDSSSTAGASGSVDQPLGRYRNEARGATWLVIRIATAWPAIPCVRGPCSCVGSAGDPFSGSRDNASIAALAATIVTAVAAQSLRLRCRARTASIPLNDAGCV